MYGRVIGGIVVVTLLAEAALAVTYMGPPTTDMRAGQWAVGVEANWSRQRVDRTSPAGTEFTIDDFQIDTVLARISVGVATNRMEVFGRIGTARVDWDGRESDDELAVGAGTRITANLDDPLSWGIVLQGLYWTFDGKDDNVEGQLAIGPCWRQDKLTIYGGPMIHALHAEGNGALLGSYEIDQKSWFGACLGGGATLWRQATLTAEVQATPDAWGVGGNLVWRF
jgi:hypothetical protein